jgi:flagellar biosynthesis chaperone FliJ
MKHKAIQTVARLRRIALDDASQALSRALAAETVAAARADDAARQIAEEAAAASSLTGNDAMVEAFAAWLPGARQHAAETREACERAGAEVARLRAVLTASRAAYEAVETLLAQRAEAQAKERDRRSQAELDEAGRQTEPR